MYVLAQSIRETIALLSRSLQSKYIYTVTVLSLVGKAKRTELSGNQDFDIINQHNVQ